MASCTTSSSAPCRRSRSWRDADPPGPNDRRAVQFHGELYDDLVRAMQKVPDLAGRELTLTALSGGITNRNFRVDAAGTTERWVIRLAGNDTHLLGISREVEHAATVAAAGVGVGPEVTAFIRPEGYLVTRFIVGLAGRRRGGPPAGDDPAGGRFAPPDPRRSGHPGPVRPAPDRRGVPRAGDGARRPHPARVPPRSRPSGGGSSWRLLAAPIELRPCHNDLLNANFIDDGMRIRIIDWEYAGMGDPFFDLGNFSINHELTHAEDRILLEAYDGLVRARPARPADPHAGRVGLPRGDVGRPPAGRQHARGRLRRLRGRQLRAAVAERR